MKMGYYLRFVPVNDEHMLYFYDGKVLFCLTTPDIWTLGETTKEYVCRNIVVPVSTMLLDPVWQKSQHMSPFKELGFDFICDTEFNYENNV